MTKNTYSKAHKKYLKNLRIKTFSIHAVRILILILILGLWELCATFNVIDPFITSSPSRVINQLGILISDGSLWHHSWITLYETILAFAISTLLGTAIALLLYAIAPLRKVLEPYLIVLNSLPKIALGPLIIVWMGTGTKSIVTMGVLICIVITTISMLNEQVSNFDQTHSSRKFQRLCFCFENQCWHELGWSCDGRISHQ